MKKRRGIRPEWDKDEGGRGKAALRFFARHGEKFVAGAVVVAALWLGLQVRNYQPLSWQPHDLEEIANSTEETINNNKFAQEDYSEIKVFNYAAYAEQIRERIPFAPYHSDTEWHPAIRLAPQPRSSVEILAAQSLRGEAVRKTSLTTQGASAIQWQRPPLSATAVKDQNPDQETVAIPAPAIWVNLYGTIPVWEQWDIYNQVLNHAVVTDRPEYVYYELERTEIKPQGVPVWQPVIVYAADDLPANRLIPFEQKQEALQDGDLLLFSDFDVEPAKTYAYRVRLYVRNPNYNLQEASVEAGVDTKSEFLLSDWSSFARIYVPDRTLVQLQSVTPTDDAVFPRQVTPLRPVTGTLFLDYFDVEQGLSLPLVEKKDVRRGMLGNMSKDEANKSINKGNTGEVEINYPDAGLRSNVCVMDFSGGRKLQKRSTREAQASPDLFAPSKALLLMPDGTMQVISTEPELFR